MGAASENGHLEVVEVLIAHEANFLYKDNTGQTPLDIAMTDDIKQFIMNHPWYRRRPLIVTRPHADHKTKAGLYRDQFLDSFFLKFFPFRKNRILLDYIDPFFVFWFGKKRDEEHQPTPLGEIITASSSSDPSSEDSVLFQLKMKVASFL